MSGPRLLLDEKVTKRIWPWVFLGWFLGLMTAGIELLITVKS